MSARIPRPRATPVGGPSTRVIEGRQISFSIDPRTNKVTNVVIALGADTIDEHGKCERRRNSQTVR